MKCCVPFCEIQSTENASMEQQPVSFFKFPVARWLKSSWLVAIGMSESQWQPDYVVCSQHFRTDDLLVSNCRPMKLRKKSVPTIFKDNCMDNNLQFCVTCLDTASNMYPLGKYLSKAYNRLTGHNFWKLKNQICHYNSEPKLCTECTQRLINCYKFREKSLKTHSLIMVLHKKRGMLTLNKIKSINRATHQLESSLGKHVIEPDDFDLYVNDDFIDTQEVNTGISEFNTELSEFNTEISEFNTEVSEFNTEITEFNTEINGVNNDRSNKPILEEEALDFDIDDETEYFMDNDAMDTNVRVINGKVNSDEYIKRNTKHINYENDDNVINIVSDDESVPQNDINKDDLMNDDRNSDVVCLDDDTDDETDYSDDFDSYLKFLNNNIVTKNDIYKGRLTKIITNTKKKRKIVDDKKQRVSLKNILLVKDTKVNIAKSIKSKHSKIDKSCDNNVKRAAKPLKSKLKGSDLNVFEVSVLSYEEQLAEIQKRKESLNYMGLPYKCNICFRGSWHTVPFNRHMEKHTDKYGLLVCAICGFHKKIRSKLISHIQVNHQYRFRCRSCPYVTTSLWQAKGHEQWHEGKVFKCQKCDHEFAKKSSYLSHLRIKHPSASHICTLCGYSYVSATGLKYHTTIQHRFEKPRTLDGPTCEECDIRFASVTAYEQHMKVSPRHAPAKNAIRNERNLSKNRRIAALKSCKMEQCSMLCELCGKTFRFRSQLSYHVRKHAVEKRFKCYHCDKSFYQKMSLVVHLESHCENKAMRERHECDACGKVFMTPSNRHRHMALHRDAKPCSKCDI